MSNIVIRPCESSEYSRFGSFTDVTSQTCTVQGVAVKSLVLLAVLACTFIYTWNQTTIGYASAFSQQVEGKIPNSIDLPPSGVPLVILGLFGGFCTALVIIFNQKTAPYLSPVYAALEGLVLGAISAGVEAKYPGIVFEAVMSTFGVTTAMLALYSSGILRPTQGFVAGVFSAMCGILMLYIADMIMMSFGNYIPIVHQNGPWAILLQVFIVGIAALNLIIDFGQIVEMCESRAPKWYEWYGAFSLLVTLVWLYIEIVNLLMKAKSDD